MDIPTEGYARALVPLPQSERRAIVEQLGDLSQYSTRELHQAVRAVKGAIGTRAAVARDPAVPAPALNALDSDDRIEQGLAEYLPHVVPPVEAIIIVHRGLWKRILDEPRPHDLGHDDWLRLCGPRGLWRFPGANDPCHPTPFPEELPRRLLQLFSWRQDVVADPFVGRGTTAAVAARLGRGVRALGRAPAYVTLTRSWVGRVRAAAAAARLSSMPAE